MIATTNSASFDVCIFQLFPKSDTFDSAIQISKVHLTDTRKVVVVDLEPCAKMHRESRNDMPYWRRWTEVCIEVCLFMGLTNCVLIHMSYYRVTHHTNQTRQLQMTLVSLTCLISYRKLIILVIADPAQHARLEYLRPILGHIHSGGLRFKGCIQSAFKRQGLLLSQSHRQLVKLRATEKASTSPDDLLLRSLWHRSRELHYVGHFREPLDVDVGDIGYIIGIPPQFVRLKNVCDRLSDGTFQHLKTKAKTSRFIPRDRWTTEVVQGVVRHVFDVILL